ncbi:MAG: tetratricopeptide repeat protein [Fimbriimonadaceae bacterium]|nr:tetratricopeptide repeat protein [Fimbriimonadaceae bacterium]
MTRSPLLATAALLLRQGSLEQAAAVLQEALASGADPAATQQLLGELYLEQQQPELARHAALQALAAEPGHPAAARCLALAHDQLGQRQEALSTLLGVIDRDPAATVCYLDAARLLRELGQVEQAVALLQRGRQAVPTAAWELDQAVLELLAAEGLHGPLLAAAEALLAELPDDLRALEHLAAAAAERGQYGLARQTLERLMTLAPQMAVYHLRLAGLFRETGLLDRAVLAFEHLAELAPDAAVRREAREALHHNDAAQVPVVLLLARESAVFRRELRHDAATALAARGFGLSREALGQLRGILGELDTRPGERARYH